MKYRTGKNGGYIRLIMNQYQWAINTSDTNFPQPINGNNEKTTAILQMAMMMKFA